MFELPEFVTLARQMNQTLKGKTVQRGQLGNSPHKFVWYNRSHEEFERLTKGKNVGEARARGKWLFLPLEPGYLLVLGECGGKVLFHPAGTKLPNKYHLYLSFEDDSFLTATTQMWGAMELHQAGQDLEGRYTRNMRPTPVDPEFTPEYLSALIRSEECGNRSAKGLLTQDQLIPGLGNSIAQDILFRAGLSPKHPVRDLSGMEVRALHGVIAELVAEVGARGGRNDEVDLFGNPGGYARVMDRNAVGRPCPRCAGEVKKIQYLGGACYFCTRCQV